MSLLSVFIQIESIYTPTVLLVTDCKNNPWDSSQEMDFFSLQKLMRGCFPMKIRMDVKQSRLVNLKYFSEWNYLILDQPTQFQPP